MYQCPNCGGELRFNIESGDIFCDNCKSHFKPGEVRDGAKDAEESNEYETTVFKCPQCGGEITANGQAAADFCNFCGAATILSSRIAKEKRPKYIIPFKKSKEDCKAAYRKYVRRNLFVKSDLADEKFIDSFRGIYMPYWSFRVEQKKESEVHGKKLEKVTAEYKEYKYYTVKAKSDCYYDGISFDASSSFSDSISRSIAPYDVDDRVEFDPSYLLGFYADTADVPASVYKDNAFRLADYASYDAFVKQIPEQNAEYSNPLFIDEATEEAESMYPVWFMSYRNKNRVAYATVNGQTGRVFADLPISIAKFLVGALILAIPIFLILNSFLTLLPTKMMILINSAALISGFIYMLELSSIADREKGLDDEGKTYNNKKLKGKSKANSDFLIGSISKGKIKDNSLLSVVMNIIVFFVAAITITYIAVLGSVIIFAIADALSRYFAGFLYLVGILISVSIYKGCKKLLVDIKDVKSPKMIYSLIAQIAIFVVYIINPVSDIFYYGVSIFGLVMLFMVLMNIILHYNLLTTRKLPVFDSHEGGDDRAK